MKLVNSISIRELEISTLSENLLIQIRYFIETSKQFYELDFHSYLSMYIVQCNRIYKNENLYIFFVNAMNFWVKPKFEKKLFMKKIINHIWCVKCELWTLYLFSNRFKLYFTHTDLEQFNDLHWSSLRFSIKILHINIQNTKKCRKKRVQHKKNSGFFGLKVYFTLPKRTKIKFRLCSLNFGFMRAKHWEKKHKT